MDHNTFYNTPTGAVSQPCGFTSVLLLAKRSSIAGPRIMDGLSGAASVIAVVDISAKIVSLCFQYSAAVKNAKEDIEHLQGKVHDIKGVLGEVKQLLDGRDITRLSATHKVIGLAQRMPSAARGAEDTVGAGEDSQDHEPAWGASFKMAFYEQGGGKDRRQS